MGQRLGGEAAVTPVVVLLHVGKSVAGAYAIGDAPVRSFSLGALSAAYDEKTGLAARYPTLPAFLAAEVPEWSPGRPVVLVAFSAGCWAPRAWMRDPASRRATGALVLLDGLHSALDAGGCRRDVVDGIIQYGWSCVAEPNDHMLVVTHSSIVPPGYASTTACANALRFELPSSPAVRVMGFPGSDAAAHNQQQREVGPAVMQRIVGPWISPSWAAMVATVTLTLAAVAVGAVLSS
jgi:hypothetical protein